jgi:hypothetical protein
MNNKVFTNTIKLKQVMCKKTILIAIAALLTVNVWGQTSITSLGSYVWNETDAPKTFTNKLQMSFVRNLDGFSSYGTVLAGGGFNNTGQDGGVFQIYFPYGEALGGIAPQIRLGKYDNQGWSSWETFYTSANANLATVDWAAKDLIVSGNVGIGTTSPQEKLEIKDGSLRFNNLTSIAYGSLGKIDFYNYASEASVVSSRIEGKRDSYSHKDGRLSFYTSDVDGILNEQMTIDRFGNVGIGTTNPIKKMHVSNGVNQEVKFRLGENNVTDFTTSSNGSLTINSDVGGSDGKMYLNVRDLTHITLSGNGQVGIGTTSPTYKLAVKGTIGCGEIIVEDVTQWADFVFEPTYNLMPLKELNNYIQENKHLPEIPTTAEVQENGISVGEMNAKLLQKIEELTLYVIEQNKLMIAQQNEINELRKIVIGQ